MALKSTPFDAAEYLDTPEMVRDYLEAAFEDGDPAMITHALGVVARAKGMTAMAKETGVTREALYRALSTDGDPRLSTFIGVIKALGMKLDLKAA